MFSKTLLMTIGAALGWGMLAGPAALKGQSIVFIGGSQTTFASGLNAPLGVAVDAGGNVLVADTGNNVVRKFPAGGGEPTTIGSNLNAPNGVAVMASGDVLIVDTSEVVTLVPANGGAQKPLPMNFKLRFPFGVAVNSVGVIAISDDNHRLRLERYSDGRWGGSGGADDSYWGMAVAENNQIVIADAKNNFVKWVSERGFIGRGLLGPKGVAVDTVGNVFIADTDNGRVVEVVAGSRVQVDIATGLNHPTGVAVDGTGNIFIADTGNNRVVKVQKSPIQFGAVGACPSGQDSAPGCKATMALNYLVTDFAPVPHIKVLTTGSENLDFTLGTGSTCTDWLPGPCTVNVTFTPKALGLRRGAVQIIDENGNVLITTLISGVGVGPRIAFGPGILTTAVTGLLQPRSVAVDDAGNVFVAEEINGRIVEAPAGGGPPTIFPVDGSPSAVALDGAGQVYFIDGVGGNSLNRLSTDGGPNVVVASGLNRPFYLAIDGMGNFFISTVDGLLKLPPGGGVPTHFGSRDIFARGTAVDADNGILVADEKGQRVVKIPANGGPQTVIGSFNDPTAVAVDGGGNVFVAAEAASVGQIIKVPADGGSQVTVASGVSFVPGLAVNQAGDIFITDLIPGDESIRVLERSRPPALNFSAARVGVASSDSPHSITLENGGNTSLSVSGLQLGANFSRVPGPGSPQDCEAQFLLAPGTSCNLSISFIPTTVGPLQSAAVLTDNSLNSDQAVQTIILKGTGLKQSVQGADFTLAVTPPSQTISSGHAASYSVALASKDGATGSVTLVCVEGPPHSNCTISPASLMLNGSAAAKVTVTLCGPRNADHGTFPLTIRASAGKLIHTATVSLMVKGDVSRRR